MAHEKPKLYLVGTKDDATSVDDLLTLFKTLTARDKPEQVTRVRATLAAIDRDRKGPLTV